MEVDRSGRESAGWKIATMTAHRFLFASLVSLATLVGAAVAEAVWLHGSTDARPCSASNPAGVD